MNAVERFAHRLLLWQDRRRVRREFWWRETVRLRHHSDQIDALRDELRSIERDVAALPKPPAAPWREEA